MAHSTMDRALRHWLKAADACWSVAQQAGVLVPLCPDTPTQPWTAEQEWAITGWTALRAALADAGVTPARPLPETLTRLRDEEGRTVVAMLLRLHAKSAHPDIWLEPLGQALAWGCNPWMPGMDGDSALLKLLDVTDSATMQALVAVFDQAAVAWDHTFDPEQLDPLVAGPDYPWVVHPTDTLLEQAAFAGNQVIEGLDTTGRLWLLSELVHRLRPDLARTDALDRTLAEVLLPGPAGPLLHHLEGEQHAQDRQEQTLPLEASPTPRRPRRRA